MMSLFENIKSLYVLFFSTLKYHSFQTGDFLLSHFSSCLLYSLSHPFRCPWEASYLSSKTELTREMLRHIIAFKHAILSLVRLERQEDKQGSVLKLWGLRSSFQEDNKGRDDVLVCVRLRYVSGIILIPPGRGSTTPDGIRGCSDVLCNVGRQVSKVFVFRVRLLKMGEEVKKKKNTLIFAFFLATK